MCQKAFGGFFAALVATEGLQWITEPPARFQSSNQTQRGFCAKCGTPLTYEVGDHLEIATGSLDDPTIAPPTVQGNTASRLPFFKDLSSLSHISDKEQADYDAWNAGVISNQHPDQAD